MSYIEYDSSTVTFGNAELSIRYNGEEIERFPIPAPKLGEKYKDSINSEYFWFEFEDIEYELEISSSNVGTYITIDTDKETHIIDNFEIIIDTYKEHFVEEESDLILPLYVPVLPFTTTTSSVLFELVEENIIPLLDIETVDKLKNYEEDELIDFKHFLDISSIKDIINREERENAKLKRKEERKLYGSGNSTTPIPEAKQQFINYDEKAKYLNNLSSNKDNVIPIYKWENSHAEISHLKKFIRDLSEDYNEIAIRVSSGDISSFIAEISTISKIMADNYLLLDMNTNYNRNEIKNIIIHCQKYKFKQIIYIGAHFNPEDISIKEPDTNENIIFLNKPLNTYVHIYSDILVDRNVGFGDYCGFDRKTITEMPSGGRPTARVVLNSIDKGMKVLVRRGWSEKDVTRDIQTKRIKRLGYKHSMLKLLCDIQKGKLDKYKNTIYMNEVDYDADLSLKEFCPDITTPGVIKTLCLRHNIMAIIKNFMK